MEYKIYKIFYKIHRIQNYIQKYNQNYNIKLEFITQNHRIYKSNNRGLWTNEESLNTLKALQKRKILQNINLELQNIEYIKYSIKYIKYRIIYRNIIKIIINNIEIYIEYRIIE